MEYFRYRKPEFLSEKDVWLCNGIIIVVFERVCIRQVLAYSVACVCVSAFSADIIDAAKAEEVMTSLRTLTEESQQVSSTVTER